MNGSLLLSCFVSVIAIAHCRTIQKSDGEEVNTHALFDGYKPYISRPRYGSGKRSAKEDTDKELYYELRDFSNNDLGDYDVILLQEPNDADSDTQPNHRYRWRHMFRQFGRKKDIPRTERFGSINQGRDANRENRVAPRWGRFGRDETRMNDVAPRWGRFGGDETRMDDVAPRWGRFGGDEKRMDDVAPRWGRFGGDETRMNDVAPRWGRFGDEVRSSELAPRWGRFGGDEIRGSDDRYGDETRKDEGDEEEESEKLKTRALRPRWGRFGGKRSVKVLLIDNSMEEDDN